MGEEDSNIFQDIIKDIHEDFHQNPFQYVNEEPVVTEIYYRLRKRLKEVNLPVRFRTDYGTEMKKYRKKRLSANKKAEGGSDIFRVRKEVSFMDCREKAEPWRKGGKDGKWWKFDLAIFSKENNELIMHSKKMGIGNHLDLENSLSVLCEVKHSRNMGDRFYSDGKKDVITLSQFPGDVEERAFIFLDFWPKYQNDDKRFDNHREKLCKNVQGDLDKEVKIYYIPRKSKLMNFTLPR